MLLVAAYWRTNLTLRQLAPLFGVSKSAADRIIDHLGPAFALQQRKRFRKDAVLIADGTPMATHPGAITRRRLDQQGHKPANTHARSRLELSKSSLNLFIVKA